MPDCLLTCFWLVCLFVYRLLFGDLYFQHTELHFEHILQELLEMAGGRERATTWFLLREPSKARRGLERPSRDTSPSKCAAKLMWALGCKDTLVPVFCVGCLPLAEMGILQPLTLSCGNLPRSREIPLCRVCSCCISLSYTSLPVLIPTTALQIEC